MSDKIARPAKLKSGTKLEAKSPGTLAGKPQEAPPHFGSMELHEAGPGFAYAVVPPFAGEDVPRHREARLAARLVTEVARNNSDVNVLCATYDLKREELGRLTGFSLRALADWASGDLPSQPAKRRLQEVRRLLDALSEIVKRESIPQWLHQRNPAFGDLTPLQVIEVGEMDRLWAMVHEMGAGRLE